MRHVRLAERTAAAAGVVTVAVGTALTLAPSPVARRLGLGDRGRSARAIGLADLALAPGLLAGRPRWPWMAARAAMNLFVAGRYRAGGRAGADPRVARAGATAMTALTALDGTVAVILFRAGR